MIVHRCPECDAGLDVSPELAGKLVACGGCGVNLRLPNVIDVPESIEQEVEELVEQLPAAELQQEKDPANGLEEMPDELDDDEIGDVDAVGIGSFEFVCPFCEAKLQAGPEDVGVEAPCPACSETIFINTQDTEKSNDKDWIDWGIEDKEFDESTLKETEWVWETKDKTDKITPELASLASSVWGKAFQIPEKDSEPTPATLNKPEPVAIETPEPVAIETPEPVAINKPEPVAINKPEPVAINKPEPVAIKKPEPVAINKPEPVAINKPEPVAIKKPEPVKEKKSEPIQLPITPPLPAKTKAKSEPIDLGLDDLGELKVDSIQPATIVKKKGKSPLVWLVAILGVAALAGILISAFFKDNDIQEQAGVIEIPDSTSKQVSPAGKKSTEVAPPEIVEKVENTVEESSVKTQQPAVAAPVLGPSPYYPRPYYRAPSIGDAPTKNTLAIIDAYLRAPNWRARLPYTYLGNVFEETIETYYQENKDFSFDTYELKLIEAEQDLDQGGPYWVYEIFQDNQSVFPIVIREKAGLLKIDWQVHTEFNDQQFIEFKNSNHKQPKSFRVMVKKLTEYPGSDRSAFENLENFDCYQLNTPFGKSSKEIEYAFVEKGSITASKLDKLVDNKNSSASILTLDHRDFSHGIRHLVIKDLLSESWLHQ